MCTIGSHSGELSVWVLFARTVMNLSFDRGVLCLFNAFQCWFASGSYGWYFTFVQGWVYIVLILLQGFTPKQMVNSWLSYWKLSAVLMGSNGLTKGSLAYLNYPAQIMFKSTKVNSGYNSLGLIKVLS